MKKEGSKRLINNEHAHEHNSIDYSRLAVYGGIFAGTIWFWYSVFTNGFFPTSMWLIVSAAVFGLWLRLSGRA